MALALVRSGRSGRRVSVSTAGSGRLPGPQRALPGSATFWPDARYGGRLPAPPLIDDDRTLGLKTRPKSGRDAMKDVRLISRSALLRKTAGYRRTKNFV